MCFSFHFHQALQPTAPIVLSAPHGGRKLPVQLLEESRLSYEKLLATSDFWTDQLASIRSDVSYLAAKYARIVVDLNRAPELLDRAVIQGAPSLHDAYVRAGYGVVPRFAERGCLIRDGKISFDEAQQLLDQYFHPYHQQLSQALLRVRERFGYVLLIDIHSAPAHLLQSVDIVLGTDHGGSMHPSRLNDLRKIFERNFNKVALNDPFSGGYITQHHAARNEGIECLQIEINRDLLEGEGRKFCKDFLSKWEAVLDEIVQGLEWRDENQIAAE